VSQAVDGWQRGNTGHLDAEATTAVAPFVAMVSAHFQMCDRTCRAFGIDGINVRFPALLGRRSRGARFPSEE
jgi:hypothetical protein